MRYLLLAIVLYFSLSAWLNDLSHLHLWLIALTLSLFAFWGVCALYDRHGRPR